MPPLLRRPSVWLALLSVLTVATFFPGLRGDFLWDDHLLIQGNGNLHRLSRLGAALTHDFWSVSDAGDLPAGMLTRYYRPAVTLAYALEYQLFGPRPFGYHLVSLGLHLGCVLLAWRWLRRRYPGGVGLSAGAGAFVGAALFALHPSRPESVVWISGCTDLWLTLGVLLALEAWDRRRGSRDLALTTLATVIAMLCKESAVVLPVLLATDAALTLAPGEARRRAYRHAAVLGAVLSLALAVRVTIVPLRTAGALGTSGMAARVASSAGIYLRCVAWPWPPSVLVGDIPLGPHGMQYPPWSVALGAILFVALAALAVTAWRRPGARPWLADALWFVLPLAPTLNLVPLGTRLLVAPHYLYLPLLGVAALVTRSLGCIPVTRASVRVVALTFAALVLGVCAGVSRYQSWRLRSEPDLWTYELSRNPRSVMSLEVLVGIEGQRGHHRAALAYARRGFRAATDLRRPDEQLRFLLLAAEEQLALTPDEDLVALAGLRDFYDALATPGAPARLRAEGLRVRVVVPVATGRTLGRDVLHYRVPRATAYARAGALAEAARQLEATVRVAPGSAEAWRTLALVDAGMGRWPEAREAVVHAQSVRSGDPSLAALRARIEAAGGM